MAENEIPIWDPDAIDWGEVRFWRSVPGVEKVIISLRLEEIRRRIVTARIRRDHAELGKREVLDRYREWLDSPEVFDLYLQVRRPPGITGGAALTPWHTGCFSQ
jgi:hypothetical protein